MGRYAPIDHDAPQVWTVDDLLSGAECDEVARKAEALGFEPASIAYRGGARLNLEARDNQRVTFEDEGLRALLFERARPHLPPIGGAHAVGLNERLRVYRYAPGERFAMHRDGWVTRPDGARTRVTLMVYLTDTEAGGHTVFPPIGRDFAPARGRALLFQHALLHEAQPVERGIKLVLRTDVFYAS